MSPLECEKKLVLLGLVLFLVGLLNGAIVQRLRNPRMGLSAHLTGVQNGLVLIVFGLLWPKLTLSEGLSTLAFWMSVYSMFGLWLGLFLSAIWGTSRATPLAGAGFSASPGRERFVSLLILSASASILASTTILLLNVL